MMLKFFDKRGASLVEVLSASAILCIIMVAVGSFLFSNMFSFKAANTNITLEREGRAALNAAIDTIRKNSAVAMIGIDTKTNYEALESTSINNVEFLTFSDGTTLRAQDGKLTLDDSTILSRSLNRMQVEPLVEGSTYKECKGLRIILKLTLEGKDLNIESEAYFRNTR